MSKQALLTTEKRPYVIAGGSVQYKTNPGMVELKLYTYANSNAITYGQRLLTLFNALNPNWDISDTVIQNLLMNLNVEPGVGYSLNSVEYYLPKLQPGQGAEIAPIAQQALYGELMIQAAAAGNKLNQYGLPNRIDPMIQAITDGNFSSLDINTSSALIYGMSTKDLDDFLSIDGIIDSFTGGSSAKWQVTALIDDVTHTFDSFLAKLPGEVQREIGNYVDMANGTDYASVKARLESTMNIAGQLLSKGWDTLTDLRDSALSAVKVNQEGKTALSYLSPGGAGSTKEALPVIDPQKRDVSEPFQAGSAASGVSPPQRVPTFASNEKFGNVFGGGDQVTVGGKKAATAKAGETFDKISNIGNTISQSTIGNAERGIESAQNLYNNQISSTTGAIENKVNDVQNRV
ncbi:hypothetical protein SPFM14_00045 [Salmonella phage SPFM14]|nr:hypothetical protein SPFM14_00045 [Salmonella phage SPFM14]